MCISLSQILKLLECRLYTDTCFNPSHSTGLFLYILKTEIFFFLGMGLQPETAVSCSPNPEEATGGIQ